MTNVKIAVNKMDTTLEIDSLKIVLNTQLVQSVEERDMNTIMKLNIPLVSLPFIIFVDGYIDSDFQKDQLAKAKILKYIEKVVKPMIVAYEKVSSEMDDSFR